MTHLNRKSCLAGIFLWFLLAPAITLAQSGSSITLDQAIQIALEKSPVLSAARSRVAAAEARVQQAEAAYLPQVSAAGEYAHGRNETQSSLRVTEAEGENYAAGLSLNQYLYDFGRTRGLVDRDRYGLVSGQDELETAKLALVRDVKLSYLEALKKRQLVGVDIEALQLKKHHLEQAKALYRQGLRPKIDFTRSEVEVSQSALFLLQSRYALQQAMATLERLMGGAPASEDYVLVEESRTPRPPDALQTLLAQAYEKRADLSGLRAQVSAAEASLKSVKGSTWPSASAGGSYQYAGTAFPLDERWEAGILLRWELFTGFERTGKIKESEAEIRRLRALLDNRKLTVTEEVIQSHLKVHETAESYNTAVLAFGQATENLKMAEGRYQAGLSNIIELLDAQVLYTQMQSAVVQTLYDHSKAWAALEYAVGNRPIFKDAGQPQTP